MDAGLDPDLTDPSRSFPRAAGVRIDADNVRIENTVIAGVNDIHTGFNTLNQTSCKEFDSGTKGGGMIVISGDNIGFKNITVYGFNDALSVQSAAGNVVVEDSLIRNNFNGMSLEGKSLTVRNSVLWVHPNHQFSIKTTQPGSFFSLENNLLVDAQDMVKAGAAWEGADELYVIHNTFWTPANNPCNVYREIQANNVRDKIVIKDNVIVSVSDNWMTIASTQIPFLTSDFNLGYRYEGIANNEFDIDGSQLIHEDWVAQTGQDSNSIVRQEPLFVDAPQYEDFSENQWGFRIPSSVAEARSWLTLAAGSPGKNAASDGKDIGILADGSVPPPSDSIPPIVSILSPSSGSTTSGVLTISASASDNVGVSSVQFKVDGIIIATDTTNEYSVSWDTTTATDGPHHLIAVATDSSGNSTVSSSVAVTVSNGSATPAAPTNLRGNP